MLAALALVALTTMPVPAEPVLSPAEGVDPYTMVVIWENGEVEEISATNFAACDKAMNALANGKWVPVGHTDRPAKAICMPGSSFAPGWDCIVGFDKGCQRK